jgi:thioredoxin-dependent peroxiredoxin
MSVPSPGAAAPDFRLPTSDGSEIGLADFAGRQLVIFFFPRAGTSGCTAEAKAFSDLASAYAAADTALLGVAADTPAVQAAFKVRYGLTIPLASDVSHGMLSDYGVWGKKSLYGKSYMGIVRTTVLIDRSGAIVRVWPKVKVAGHATEVLAAARAHAAERPKG